MQAFAPGIELGPRIENTRKGTVAHVRASTASVLRQDEAPRPAGWCSLNGDAASRCRDRDVRRWMAYAQLVTNAFNYEVVGAAGFDSVRDLVAGGRCFTPGLFRPRSRRWRAYRDGGRRCRLIGRRNQRLVRTLVLAALRDPLSVPALPPPDLDLTLRLMRRLRLLGRLAWQLRAQVSSIRCRRRDGPVAQRTRPLRVTRALRALGARSGRLGAARPWRVPAGGAQGMRVPAGMHSQLARAYVRRRGPAGSRGPPAVGREAASRLRMGRQGSHALRRSLLSSLGARTASHAACGARSGSGPAPWNTDAHGAG